MTEGTFTPSLIYLFIGTSAFGILILIYKITPKIVKRINND